MTTIVTQGPPVYLTLEAGAVLTVTADALSNGLVRLLDRTGYQETNVPASGTRKFGVFPALRRYSIECAVGTLSYRVDQPDLDYGTQLGNIEAFTGARLLRAEDNGKLLRCDDTSNVVITVPDFLPEGFNVAYAMWSTGTVSITAGAGATARDSKSGVATQYKVGSLLVVKNANGVSAEYLLGGDAA